MRIVERAVRIAAHLTIALSLAFVTFLVLDYFNPLMSFVSNEASTPLLGVFCALSLVVALTLLRRDGAARGMGPSRARRAERPTPSLPRSHGGDRPSERSRTEVTIH